MRSDLHKFNRLKKLQKSYHDTMQELGAKVEGIGRTSMLEGGLEVYENIRTELGDFDFALPDARLMEEMIDRPWLGKNFSGRVWGNIKTLEKELNQTLVRGLTQGKTVTQVAFNLNGVMNKGFYKAYRLVRTETMHYLNESSKKAYEDAKCEYVELWAALDERTCPVCGMMHGNEYPIKDAPVLPLHANCRCTYLPVVDKNTFTLARKGDIISKQIAHTSQKAKDILEKQKPVDRTTLERTKARLREKGIFLDQSLDGDRYLENTGREAIIFSDGTILLHTKVSSSGFYEELIHLGQILKHGSGDFTEIERIENEIRAQIKLLRYAKAYKITDFEIEGLKKNLAYYRRELKKLKGKG